MQCPGCHQSHPSHAKFCLECGTPFAGAAPIARFTQGLKAENEGLRRSLSEAFEESGGRGLDVHVLHIRSFRHGRRSPSRMLRRYFEMSFGRSATFGWVLFITRSWPTWQ
jgi:hypothetical protein